MSEAKIVWRSYPEDVPDMDKDYLVTVKNKIGQRYTTSDIWEKDGFIHRDISIIAWAEMPEPYQPGSKE